MRGGLVFDLVFLDIEDFLNPEVTFLLFHLELL